MDQLIVEQNAAVHEAVKAIVARWGTTSEYVKGVKVVVAGHPYGIYLVIGKDQSSVTKFASGPFSKYPPYWTHYFGQDCGPRSIDDCEMVQAVLEQASLYLASEDWRAKRKESIRRLKAVTEALR